MGLEPRHMGIAEQRQTRRRQLGAVNDVADGLARQSIHQIDIEVGDASGAHGLDGRLDLLERLDATDRLLHMRREILCPKLARVTPMRPSAEASSGVTRRGSSSMACSAISFMSNVALIRSAMAMSVS